MTADEWNAATDPTKMLEFLRLRPTVRQARLLMVACCRLVSVAYPDPRIERVLSTAEVCADDPESEMLAANLWWRWTTADRRLPQPGSEQVIGKIISEAFELVEDIHRNEEFDESEERYLSPSLAVGHAVFMAFRDKPLETFTGGSGNAVWYCLRAIGQVDSFGSAASTQARMATLIRDIFGNPFSPPAVDPAWLTSTVLALAHGIYDGKAFDRLPILADALADAGCENDGLLSHCRGDGPHVRGCWAVDLILGKV